MEVNLQDISDGKLYSLNDMVKVGCHDCAGCSECCQDMGQSILLDPYDVFRLTKNLGVTFQQLMEKNVELHVEDGLILPNLKMVEPTSTMTGNDTISTMAEKDTTSAIKTALPSCSFLNPEGRCSIHQFRPGICRLFPLGRSYEEDKLKYFLLTDACPIPNKTKMKVGKWLEMPQLVSYEKFLVTWHNFVKGMRSLLEEHGADESYTKMLTVKFLEIFYLKPYETEDFYGEFQGRLETAKVLTGL